MARPEKEAVVSELTRRLSSSEAALLTEYRGLTVTQMAEVRSALRAVGADLKVYKNTLARIAVKEAGYDGLEGDLQGPTAIAFCQGDPSAAAKALDDSIKKFPVLVLKGGVLSGRVVRADQAQELARLEPREVQLAKIVMMVNSPLQQTANVFSALLRDFGSMLAQVIAQKESGGDAAAA